MEGVKMMTKTAKIDATSGRNEGERWFHPGDGLRLAIIVIILLGWAVFISKIW
jgi:hypothetical protein